MAVWTCLLCDRRVWLRFLLCPDHREEFGEYKEWPQWLLFMARQERARRYRESRGVKEYGDSSLEAMLEAQRAAGHEDNTWLWLGYVSDDMERLVEVRLEAIEVLAGLESDELAILLLAHLGFTYVEIGEVLHIGKDAAWKRFVKAKKRLREARLTN